MPHTKKNARALAAYKQIAREAISKNKSFSREGRCAASEGLEIILAEIQKELRKLHPIDEPLSAQKAFEGMFGDKPAGAIHLKGLRVREGLTQTEMAEVLGITQSNLSAYENGKRGIGKKLAKKLGEIFKVNYQSFL